jgi:hypothetical protein
MEISYVETSPPDAAIQPRAGWTAPLSGGFHKNFPASSRLFTPSSKNCHKDGTIASAIWD